MGMLLMVCSAIAALCVAGAVGSPWMVAAVALAGVVAAACSVVTGFSIRDLVRSCKQVKQVKEEGLVTVQSLQPVLTPVTPNVSEVGKRVSYGITAAGTAAAAGAGGYFATQAVGNGVLAGASAYASTVAAAIKAAVASAVGTGTAVGKAVGTGTGAGIGGKVAGKAAGLAAKAALAEAVDITAAGSGTGVGVAVVIEGAKAATASATFGGTGVYASAATAGEAAAKAFGAATGATLTMSEVLSGNAGTAVASAGNAVGWAAGDGVGGAGGVAEAAVGGIWGVKVAEVEVAGLAAEAARAGGTGAVAVEGTIATGIGGTGITANVQVAAAKASGAKAAAAVVTITGGAAALAFIPYALMAFSILISVCTIIQTIADLYSAKVPDLLNHDEIEDYKHEKKAGMRMLKWLTPPLAASPKYRLLMALACIAITICVALLLPLSAGTIAAIAPPLVSCLFYGYAAYACKRRGRKKSVIPDTSPCIETTAEPLEQSPPSTPEQEVCADPTVTALVHNTQDWEPVAKTVDAGQEWVPTQQGPVGVKEAGVDGTSQAPSDKTADIMKSLEQDAGFLRAAGDLFQAMTQGADDTQDWEPVAKTVAQPSRAR
nr:hypothetical protein [Anaplasma centrale]